MRTAPLPSAMLMLARPDAKMSPEIFVTPLGSVVRPLKCMLLTLARSR